MKQMLKSLLMAAVLVASPLSMASWQAASVSVDKASAEMIQVLGNEALVSEGEPTL